MHSAPDADGESGYVSPPSPLQIEEVLQKMQYISDALQSTQQVDVQSEWAALLSGRWREIAQRMKTGRVPGLPPPFARKANAPRDPAKLAALVMPNSDWRGVRTWRRKLLHYPSDGARPPFYGSFSQRRFCSLQPE
jgi:hypothetical protein